jgi:hypothetical protein
VDDSSLDQARKNGLKGKSGLVKFGTKPDMETSHVPTLQDNSRVSQAITPLFKVRERRFTLGKSG